MTEFDATAILSTPLSESGAQGKKPLLPEGMLNNCLIKEMDSFEPSDEKRAAGVKVVVKILMETPDHPDLVSGYINISDPANPHPSSNLFQLVNAIWPNLKDRVGKTVDDWVGEVVNIMVVHGTNTFTGEPCAKLNYREVS